MDDVKEVGSRLAKAANKKLPKSKTVSCDAPIPDKGGQANNIRVPNSEADFCSNLSFWHLGSRATFLQTNS